ncbi:hypothetical protein ACIBRY_32135 [Streptomyces anulatus]
MSRYVEAGGGKTERIASFPPVVQLHRDPSNVEVQGGSVAIPSHICNEEPGTGCERTPSETQQMVLHCLYSRHHEGRVRQRHLDGQIVASGEP